MDREARQEYDVVIQAKDMGGHMGGLSGTTEVKITLTDVNDNPPKFPQSECKHLLYLCVCLSSFSTCLQDCLLHLLLVTCGLRALSSCNVLSFYALQIVYAHMCIILHVLYEYALCVFTQPIASNILQICGKPLHEAQQITWEINY